MNVNTLSVMKLLRKILYFIFGSKCPKCGKKCLMYSHEEPIGGVWMNVYECSNCGELFI